MKGNRIFLVGIELSANVGDSLSLASLLSSVLERTLGHIKDYGCNDVFERK